VSGGGRRGAARGRGPGREVVGEELSPAWGATPPVPSPSSREREEEEAGGIRGCLGEMTFFYEQRLGGMSCDREREEGGIRFMKSGAMGELHFKDLD